ncbi:MAG: hypothetical protein QM626_12245 [Microbacterium sp.]|uniref:hypothetical protein n=1 Tax=Microbacterium sp. TaxID=51671 RepID=UPI0039E339B2
MTFTDAGIEIRERHVRRPFAQVAWDDVAAVEPVEIWGSLIFEPVLRITFRSREAVDIVPVEPGIRGSFGYRRTWLRRLVHDLAARVRERTGRRGRGRASWS